MKNGPFRPLATTAGVGAAAPTAPAMTRLSSTAPSASSTASLWRANMPLTSPLRPFGAPSFLRVAARDAGRGTRGGARRPAAAAHDARPRREVVVAGPRWVARAGRHERALPISRGSVVVAPGYSI